MINSFDFKLYKLINQSWTNDNLDFLMFQFSDKYFWIPFYCVILWMLSRQYGKKMWPVLLGLAIAVAASDRFTSGVMKPMFERPRPCHELSLSPRIIENVHCSDTGSMASSHAANHFAIAIFMISLYGWKKYSNVAFWLFWAFAVGYSRVYLGVHYPTDVIVGALVGAIFGALSYFIYLKINNKINWK